MLRGLFLALMTCSTLFAQTDTGHRVKALINSLNTAKENPEQIYFQIGQLYSENKQYDSATLFLNKALNGYQKMNYMVAIGYSHNNLGVLFHKAGNTDSSVYHYNRAIEYYTTIKDSVSLASSQTNLGILYKEMGSYELSLQYLLSALRILEIVNDSSALASCYNTVANVYSQQENFIKSITYHKSALAIASAINDAKKLSSSLNNIGINYRKLEQYDSALYYLQKALDLKKMLNDSSVLASTYNNMGLVYLNIGESDLAINYFVKSLRKGATTDKPGRATTYNNLGRAYLNLGDLFKSRVFLDSALVVIQTMNMLSEKLDNYRHRVELYELLHEPEKSLSYAKKVVDVKDSLMNIEKMQSLIEMQTIYETEKKEQSIATLQIERDLQNAELKLSQQWIITLIVTIAFALMMGMFAYNRFRSEHRNKKHIELLMQELHHRVKNNLQLLSTIFNLQSRTIKDANALEAVRSGENRISAMSIIHQKLYRKTDARTVNIQEYLSDLILQLADTFGHDRPEDHLIMEIDSFELDVDKVIPLGLIVNELASNTYKYAFPSNAEPKLSIALKVKDNKLDLKISDNGPGFKKTTRLTTSMGLNIIDTLSRQLNAKTNWMNINGTHFNLVMNIN